MVQEAAIRGVTPLGKGMTLPGEARLAAKRFLARPEGTSPPGHCGVAILAKGRQSLPREAFWALTADRALP